MQKCFTLILLIASFVVFVEASFAAVSTLGYRESDSYIITSDNFASMNDEGVSSAYKLTGLVQAYDLGEFLGSSYNIWQGFLSTSVSAQSVSITSISPDWGYNTGTLSVAISGSGFLSGAAATLTKTGETDLPATGVIVISTSEILCNFDLVGKITGKWNVVVTNSDATTASLAEGLTIKTLAVIGTLYNTPNPFNPDTGPTTIIYALISNADTSLLIFNISGELIFRENYLSGANGGRAGDNTAAWNGMSTFGERMPNGLYFCRVIDRASGKILSRGRIAISR
ncbi:MAG: IPT/TIG domain-containing protein [Candidatus Margulisiibacteriota bacterium]